MDANTLQAIFMSCQSQDANIQKAAEYKIQEIIKESPTQLIITIQDLLSNPASNQSALVLSSIIFKNSLKVAQFKQVFDSMADEAQAKLDAICLELLMNESHNKRKCASLIISSVLVNNLCKGRSSSLMKELLKLTLNEKTEARLASLEALSITVEESEPTYLKDFTDGILNSTIQVISHDTSNECISWAYKGLLHSLKLCGLNFQKENERSIILESVIKGLQSSVHDVKYSALQCVCEIVSMYYLSIDKLIEPMGHMLLGISLDDMEETDSNLLIMQVWIEICSKEKASLKEKSSKGFIEAGYKFMSEKLLSLLVKCEQEDDEEEWNMRTACGCCLGIISQIVGNSICEVVFDSVSKGFAQEAVMNKIAALIAFGTILEGPEKGLISDFLQKNFANILKCLSSADKNLCYNASWCLCQVCKVMPDFIYADNNFGVFVESITPMMKLAPKICNNACLSYYYITESSKLTNHAITLLSQPKTLLQIIQSLWEVALRPDFITSRLNLCNSSLLAIVNLINYSQYEQGFIGQIIQKSVESLSNTLSAGLTKIQIEEHQAYFTTILYTCLEKCKSILQPHNVMDLLGIIFKIFNSRNEPYNEGFIAISIMASIIGQEFDQYLPIILPFVQIAFNSFNNLGDISIIKNACLCITETSRVVGDKLGQLLPTIISCLIKFLSDSDANREIKIVSFECIGDLALSCPAQFVPCIDQIIKIIAVAAEMTLQPITVDDGDEAVEEEDYIDRLIGSMLDCLTSVVICVKECNGIAIIENYIDGFIKYCTEVGKKYGSKLIREVWRERFKASLGIIADLSNLKSEKPKAFQENSHIIVLMLNALKSDMPIDEEEDIKYLEDTLKM